MSDNLVMGIDIGGSSVKGGIVDVNTGRVVGQRCTIEHQPLPRLARITESIMAIVREAQFEGTEIGVGFPGVVATCDSSVGSPVCSCVTMLKGL